MRDLRRIVRFGTQTDARPISRASGLPATGTDLPAPAVANYIAKYATKAISTPGLPVRPVRSPAAIKALRCPAHHKRLITTCWQLGKRPCAAQLALNRWTHMLGYRGHFLTKSRRLLGHLRPAARPAHRLPPRAAPPRAAKPTRGDGRSMSAWSWSRPPGSTPEPATPPPASTPWPWPPPPAPASTNRPPAKNRVSPDQRREDLR